MNAYIFYWVMVVLAAIPPHGNSRELRFDLNNALTG
jgi:hypothetical protein